MPQDPVITFLLVHSSCTTTAIQQARMGLLDDDGQVHALVNRTIDVVGSCRTKWPNLNAVAIEQTGVFALLLCSLLIPFPFLFLYSWLVPFLSSPGPLRTE